MAHARFFAIGAAQDTELARAARAEVLEIYWSGQRITRGRRHLQAEIASDFEAGVVMTPRRILTSGNVTVVEGTFENPPDHPFHCPPGLALILFHDGGRIVRLHLHLSPRPPRGEEDRATNFLDRWRILDPTAPAPSFNPNRRIEMHANRNDIPVTLEAGAAYSRDARWGEMNVAFEGFPAGMDTRPLFEGLPEDRCQCPHWGLLLRGRLRILYASGEEVITAGQAYYLPPGHNVVIEEDCELVEFSPQHDYERILQAVARNLEATRTPPA